MEALFWVHLDQMDYPVDQQDRTAEIDTRVQTVMTERDIRQIE